MLKYLILFLFSAFVSLLMTPLIRSLAIRKKVFDLPDERKIHKKPIPRLGGISIFVAFNLGLFLATRFEFFHLPMSFLKEINYQGLFAGSILVLGLGAQVDNKVEGSKLMKFILSLYLCVTNIRALDRLDGATVG